VVDPDEPKKGMVRARWSTPIAGYRCVEDRMLPVAASAVWHMPRSEFCYARVTFAPKWFMFNGGPGGVAADGGTTVAPAPSQS
jgi:hypothetical protein